MQHLNLYGHVINLQHMKEKLYACLRHTYQMMKHCWSVNVC